MKICFLLYKGINHSIGFVSIIDDRVHTNQIERMWRDLKDSLRNVKPRREYLSVYISEYLFSGLFENDERYSIIFNMLSR